MYINDRNMYIIYARAYEKMCECCKTVECVCVCIPILVTTFPEWLSSTEPLPHTPGAVRLSSLCLECFACTCTVLPVWWGGRHRGRSVTLQSPTATLIPLFSSSELTGCGYPGLLDRKNCSDMCPRFSAFWLRSKCSICKTVENIRSDYVWRSSFICDDCLFEYYCLY